MNKARTLRAAGALASIGVAAVLVTGGPASASSTTAKAEATVISMEQEGKNLFFDGPKTVERGDTLKIKNNTNPRKIGPHTFSLVKDKDLPGDDDIRDCERELADICGAIVKWHKVDLDTGEVRRNPVEADAKGWDQLGSKKRKGDSWVAEKRKATFKQKVTAPEGKTLTFICAVHAGMQGKIEVEG